MSTVLHRATFRTSRLLDFASRKELVAQTGHQVDEWPYVIVEELVDNAIDACEESGIAPQIAITVDQRGIEVADNGPGLPPQTVKDILDFSVRVSSREAYVSPTRGVQGNALKTLVAIPFVLSGDQGCVEIEAKGTCHTVVMGVDHIRQVPTIRHDMVQGKDGGTSVRVHLNPACSVGPDDEARFLLFIDDFAWLNPHLSLSVDYFGCRKTIGRTIDAWPKWKPSEPTSPHWYSPERFGRLIAAYIADDADKGRQRTVGDFVGEFSGLSGSAKKKAILDATRLFRAPLSHLTDGNGLDHGAIARLLAVMQSLSKPVLPDRLGIIGKEHFADRLERSGCEMDSYRYRCIKGTTSGVAWLIEAGFAYRSDNVDAGKCLITGINWSPAISNPFRHLIHNSLEKLLSDQWIDDDEPVTIALHLACASVESSRGRSRRIAEGARPRRLSNKALAERYHCDRGSIARWIESGILDAETGLFLREPPRRNAADSSIAIYC